MALQYLISPIIQLEDTNGQTLVNGKVYVYNHDTDTLATIYKDFNGGFQTNPAILDELGTTVIIANNEASYDIEVYDKDDNFVLSREMVYAAGGGGEDHSHIYDAGVDIQVRQISQNHSYIDVVNNDCTNIDYGFAIGNKTTANNYGVSFGKDTSSYNYGVAGGEETLAMNYGFAIGYQTVATGTHSFAHGQATSATNFFSHAEGLNTLADSVFAHAEGYQTSARNIYTHAEGYNTSAMGVGSHTEGLETSSNGNYSHSEGEGTYVSGIGAHAEGNQCSALNNYAHSEGYQTIASGIFSHAEGSENNTEGIASHAEGRFSYASGDYSHAEGFDTSAIQIASHTEGYQTLASGQFSHAEGMNTTTIDYGAHSQGIFTSAIGQGSFAGGHNSIASANYSVALGENVIANGESQTVLGKYNTSSTTDLFQIGNGTAFESRNNALTVDTSGSTNVYTSAGLKNTRTFFDNLGDVDYVYTRHQPIYVCTGTDFIKDEQASTSSVYAIMASDMAIPSARKVLVEGYYQIKGGIRPDKTNGSFTIDPVIETWLSAGNSAYEINAGVITNGNNLPRSVPMPFSFVTGGVSSFKLGFCSENTFQFWNGSGEYAREAGNLFISYTTTILDKE